MSNPTKDKTLALLGMAMRAGAIIDGESRVLKALSTRHVELVFLASDAGQNITKKMHDKCISANATLIDYYDAETLSKAIGKRHRHTIATGDQRFVKPLKAALSQLERGDF